MITTQDLSLILEQKNFLAINSFIKRCPNINDLLLDTDTLPFFLVIQKGDTEIAELFRQAGVNFDQGSKRFENALSCAVFYERCDMIEYLLNHSFDMNNPETRKTALGLALILAAKHSNAHISQKLIEMGADVNTHDPVIGKTALHWAAERGYHDLMSILIEHGAKIHSRDCEANTPIHLACESNHIKCASLLVDREVDLSLKNSYGYSPLGTAIIFGTPSMMKVLLAGVSELDAFVIEQISKELIFLAMYEKKCTILELLIDFMLENAPELLSDKLLATAIEQKNSRAIRSLLKNQHIIDTQLNEEVINSLFTKKSPQLRLIKLLLPCFLTQLKKMPHSSSAVDSAPSTASNILNKYLSFARSQKDRAYAEVSSFLVSLGTQVNDTSDNASELFLAAQQKDYELCSDLILLKDSETGIVNHNSALSLMIENGASLEETKAVRLITAINFYDEADPHLLLILEKAACAGNTAHLQWILDNKININLANSDGTTALMFAARERQIATVQFCIQHGANLNAVDKEGRTALFYLALENRLDSQESEALEIVKLLVDSGIDINHVDYSNKSALYYVTKNGTFSEKLIALGADYRYLLELKNKKINMVVNKAVSTAIDRLFAELFDPDSWQKKLPGIFSNYLKRVVLDGGMTTSIPVFSNIALFAHKHDKLSLSMIAHLLDLSDLRKDGSYISLFIHSLNAVAKAMNDTVPHASLESLRLYCVIANSMKKITDFGAPIQMRSAIISFIINKVAQGSYNWPKFCTWLKNEPQILQYWRRPGLLMELTDTTRTMCHGPIEETVLPFLAEQSSKFFESWVEHFLPGVPIRTEHFLQERNNYQQALALRNKRSSFEDSYQAELNSLFSQKEFKIFLGHLGLDDAPLPLVYREYQQQLNEYQSLSSEAMTLCSDYISNKGQFLEKYRALKESGSTAALTPSLCELYEKAISVGNGYCNSRENLYAFHKNQLDAKIEVYLTLTDEQLEVLIDDNQHARLASEKRGLDKLTSSATEEVVRLSESHSDLETPLNNLTQQINRDNLDKPLAERVRPLIACHPHAPRLIFSQTSMPVVNDSSYNP